jgi:hypothetical protein
VGTTRRSRQLSHVLRSRSQIAITVLMANRGILKGGSRSGRSRALQGSACSRDIARSSVLRRDPTEIGSAPLSSVDVAQLCASSSPVMGSEVFKLQAFGTVSDHIPDNILRYACAPRCSVSTHRPEYSSSRDRRSCHPSVHCAFHLNRHGNGSNVFAFTDKVHNCPMPLPDLNVLPSERR